MNRPVKPSEGARAPGERPPGSGLGRPATLLLVLLAVVGLVVPWFFNLSYFQAGGHVRPEIFFRDAGANHLTTAITWDVYLSALAFSVWVLAERRMRHAWLLVVACFAVGLSFALPVYLLLRGRR